MLFYFIFILFFLFCLVFVYDYVSSFSCGYCLLDCVNVFVSFLSHIHIHFCSFTIFYQVQLLVILFYCSSRNYTVYTQFNFLLRWFSTEVLCDSHLTSCVTRGLARYKLLSFFQSPFAQIILLLFGCY